MEKFASTAPTWAVKATALEAIKTHRLYASKGYKSFNHYVDQQHAIWHIKSRRAWKLLAHLKVAANLQKHFPTIELPEKDEFFEPLLKLTEEQQCMVWLRVLEQRDKEIEDISTHSVAVAARMVSSSTAYRSGPEGPITMTSVWTSSYDSEWHSSDEFLRKVFRVIPQWELDLDAASDEIAQLRIRAKRIITKEKDGTNPVTLWHRGRDIDGDRINVYINAPGGVHKTRMGRNNNRSMADVFLERAIYEFEVKGTIRNCIIHIRAAVGHVWFQEVYRFPHCWLKSHVRFMNPNRGFDNAATVHGSVVVFLGENVDRFCKVFGEIGYIPGYNTWTY
jgi:hypothetical protein